MMMMMMFLYNSDQSYRLLQLQSQWHQHDDICICKYVFIQNQRRSAKLEDVERPGPLNHQEPTTTEWTSSSSSFSDKICVLWCLSKYINSGVCMMKSTYIYGHLPRFPSPGVFIEMKRKLLEGVTKSCLQSLKWVTFRDTGGKFTHMPMPPCPDVALKAVWIKYRNPRWSNLLKSESHKIRSYNMLAGSFPVNSK